MLYDTVHALATSGHTVALIATCRAAPEYSVREDDFRALAGKVAADFLVADTLNSPETIDRLQLARADVAVSVNWLTVIAAPAIAAFPHGILNAHAGDLPRYRGNAPVAWAMLNGEREIAVTIHQMEPDALDSGPVLLKERLQLSECDYIGDVFARIDTAVPRLFLRAIDGLAAGTITPAPQDHTQALYGYPRRPDDGRIDWRLPAGHLARLVHVSAEPFSGAFSFRDDGKSLVIWRAHAEPWPHQAFSVPGQVVDRRPSGHVAIATGDGLLVLELVEGKGTGRVMPTELIRSRRERMRSHRVVDGAPQYLETPAEPIEDWL